MLALCGDMMLTLTNKQNAAHVSYVSAGRRRHADAFMGTADVQQLYEVTCILANVVFLFFNRRRLSSAALLLYNNV